MKLLNILARELKVWPDQYYQIFQDSGGNLHGSLSDGDLEDCDQEDLPGDPVTIAWDGNNAVVDRAEWQAAVDAIYADEPAELKWPDGSTHFQEVIGGATRPVFWNVVDGVALKAWRMMPDKVTVEETYTYCSKGCPTFNISKCIERPAPKVVEWDGVGLPPVGTVCQYQNSLGSWFKVEITAIAKKGICFIQPDLDGENYACKVSSKFRPIRTAEQVAAEKRIKEISEMRAVVVAASKSKRASIAECTATVALYDAGYRKQVAP